MNQIQGVYPKRPKLDANSSRAIGGNEGVASIVKVGNQLINVCREGIDIVKEELKALGANIVVTDKEFRSSEFQEILKSNKKLAKSLAQQQYSFFLNKIAIPDNYGGSYKKHASSVTSTVSTCGWHIPYRYVRFYPRR